MDMIQCSHPKLHVSKCIWNYLAGNLFDLNPEFIAEGVPSAFSVDIFI